MTNKYKKIAYYLLIMIMIVAGAAINSVFTLVALLFSIYHIFRADVQGIIEVQLVLVSFAELMFFSSSISLLNLVFIIAILRLLFLSKMQIKRSTANFLLVVLFVNAITIIFNGFDAIKELATFDAEMIMLALALQNRQKINIHSMIRTYAFALVMSSFVTILAQYSPSLGDRISQVTYRYNDSGDRVTRYAGLMGNPNYYTLSLNIAISMLLTRAVKNNRALFDYVLIGLMVTFGVLSLSKGFILGLAFNIAVLLGYYATAKPSKGLKLTTTGIIAFFVVIYTIGGQYLEILLSRINIGENFGSIDFNQYTTGRIDKFKLYVDYMGTHIGKLVVGNGYGTLIDGQASHNIYLEGVFFFGILGLLLLLFTLFKIKARVKGSRILFTNLIPLFVLMVRGLGINMWISISLPFYLYLIIVEIREGNNTIDGR